MPCTASDASCFPTEVEPVKVMPRMIGEPINLADISAGLPNTTFSTPSGRPLSCSSAAMASAVAGVSSDALMITEQPAASAPLIFRDGVIAGAFQDAKAAMGPIGSRKANCMAARVRGGMTRP